jgi:hypothetical protein
MAILPAWGRLSAWQPLGRTPLFVDVLLYIALAALAVHHYDRFRRGLPEGVGVLSGIRNLKAPSERSSETPN